MAGDAAVGPLRLSVVVPAHDAEATVARAVGSALAQTRRPDEVVVVDDGSSDATAAVVAALAPQVRLVSRAQGGPSAARNTGVEASCGDWIAFLDADDEWHPEKLEHQLRVAVAGDTGLVATDWSRALLADAAPETVGASPVTTHDLLVLNRFQTSTVLMRRAVFEAAGGFDSSLDGVEDWDMWLRTSRHGAVVKLDWPFVRYTDTGAGYSKSLERVYRTGLTMLERQFGDDAGHGERVLLAWHHLRFAVAFALDGDRASARRCANQCRSAGLTAVVPEAATRYLVPFLARRVGRRLGRSRTGR